ncbi:NAD(P)/FAD-dependent oxidoreductase [Chitinophaga silvatica]|uniref:NADH:ubiquinone reductase (non-electrogenic) n=1 Tax=Chitinophaga silvatica TaxID=2282649 RepID=A0A3E1YIC7_9BACT|nr:NAD(P)/FAD-dependent oxidoreductase [Chitinophaga silvatica]RFS27000.1 NAD(P)/FAD-dependent oxidoreductase [Chitinophaga silvatica]
MKHIVIIGGGFAGINLIRKLKSHDDYTITLVDRNNYNYFPPLVYQVAMAFLDPTDISYPFRKLLRKRKDVRYVIGELEEVIPSENKVILSTTTLTYDILVFAQGTTTNYFGMENVKKYALPSKTVDNALALRNHFLKVMEEACITKDAKERTKLLTIVVVGGGPTGVEVSGLLSELKKNVVPKDYPEISGKGYESHIYLVDGMPKLLAAMSEKSQKDAFNDLTKMGVEIRLGMQVKDYDGEIVTFANGESIPTKTVVWAAGVTAERVKGIPETVYTRGNRMAVDEYNKVKELNNIYAIGDIAFQTSDEAFPNGHPQLAQVAIQQGVNLAKNFNAMTASQPLKPFKYFDKGSMAIIGRNKAVADIPKPKLHFNGFIAWFVWLFIHLTFLITYRNRFRTMLNWVGAYFTRDQSLRLLMEPDKDPE